MLLVMQNLIDSIEELKAKFPGIHLNTIELGTIRNTNCRQLGQSTTCISRALGGRGSLVAVDVNANSIKASKEVCRDMNNIT